MHRRVLLSAAAGCLVAGHSRAKPGMPPKIDLGIVNIPQQTPVWCWAAVAEQIITWRRGGSPPQCVLVAAAFGAAAQRCCGLPQSCMTTGGLQQIQALLLESVQLQLQVFAGRIQADFALGHHLACDSRQLPAGRTENAEQRLNVDRRCE